jgi:hypothetical protein
MAMKGTSMAAIPPSRTPIPVGAKKAKKPTSHPTALMPAVARKVGAESVVARSTNMNANPWRKEIAVMKANVTAIHGKLGRESLS